MQIVLSGIVPTVLFGNGNSDKFAVSASLISALALLSTALFFARGYHPAQRAL
jgi:hypothetical protein